MTKIKLLALAGAALLLACAPAGAANQVIDGDLIGSGAPPVLSACGTSPAVVGSDLAGVVTMGTGTPTGCVITFAVAKAAAPKCVVMWQAQILASQSYTVTNTAITLVQTATSSNKVSYICVQ